MMMSINELPDEIYMEYLEMKKFLDRIGIEILGKSHSDSGLIYSIRKKIRSPLLNNG